MENRCYFFLLFLFSLCLFTHGQGAKKTKNKQPGFDILIYGSGPTAVAAALVSQDQGLRVAVCFPEKNILPEKLDCHRLLMQKEYNGIVKKLKDILVFPLGRPSQTIEKQKDTIFLENRLRKEILSLLHAKDIVLFNQSTVDTFQNLQTEGRFRLIPTTIISVKNKKKRRQIGVGYFIDASPEGTLAVKLSCRFLKLESITGFQSGHNHRAIMGKFLVSQMSNPLGFPGQSIGFISGQDNRLITFPLGAIIPVYPRRLICPGPIFSDDIDEFWFHDFAGQLLLGQAAALAAKVGLKRRCFANQILFSEIQELLIKNNVALVDFQPTIFPGDSLFYPIQKLASLEWIPCKLSDLEQPFSEEEILAISLKSGFSSSEITEIVGLKPKRSAIPLFWQFVEKAGKGL